MNVYVMYVYFRSRAKVRILQKISEYFNLIYNHQVEQLTIKTSQKFWNVLTLWKAIKCAKLKMVDSEISEIFFPYLQTLLVKKLQKNLW